MNAQKILKYWFTDDPAENMKKWWQKDPEQDQYMRLNFSDDLQNAISADDLSWQNDPESCLAYIILLDQFSRNIFRGTSASFSQDSLALNACQYGIEQGFADSLTFMQQYMFYMPLMHSEELDLQEKSVATYIQLSEKCDSDLKPYFNSAVDYAIQHRDIIKRFNRFPHRNEILGRESTQEEIEFLKQPNSSF